MRYKKAREEKDLQDFLGNFKKDRQGNVAPVGEIKFPPLHVEQVKPSMSTTFSLEQWAGIDSRISNGNNLVYRACLENTSASKNMPPLSSGSVGTHASLRNPSSVLPLSSAPPMPMNYFPTHTNQVMAAPISPIMNNIGSLSNYGSVYAQPLLGN